MTDLGTTANRLGRPGNASGSGGGGNQRRGTMEEVSVQSAALDTSAKSEHVRYLATSTLASELDPDELATLAERTDLRRCAKGEALIAEGEQNDRLYTVVRGNFFVLRSGPRGQERLATLVPGMITGELAFLDGLKRTASVVAENDDCHAISLSRAQLESLLFSHPQIVYKVMRAVVRNAHRTVNRMDNTYTELLGYISS